MRGRSARFRPLTAAEFRFFLREDFLRHLRLEIGYGDGVLLCAVRGRPIGLLERGEAPLKRGNLLLVKLLYLLDLLLQLSGRLSRGLVATAEGQRPISIQSTPKEETEDSS